MTVFSCFYIKVGNLTQKTPQKPKKIELRMFLVTVSKTDEFSELQDPEWESDLPFGGCNWPSEQPQSEECVFLHKLCSYTQAFKSKLTLFSRPMTNSCFTQFPTLATLVIPSCHTSRYTTTLTDLHMEFNWCLSDFAKTERELELVSDPISFDRGKKGPFDAQLGLIVNFCLRAGHPM